MSVDVKIFRQFQHPPIFSLVEICKFLFFSASFMKFDHKWFFFWLFQILVSSLNNMCKCFCYDVSVDYRNIWGDQYSSNIPELLLRKRDSWPFQFFSSIRIAFVLCDLCLILKVVTFFPRFSRATFIRNGGYCVPKKAEILSNIMY